jgi:hypothetical protein
MVRLVALRLRSDLDSRPNCHQGPDISKIGKLAGIILSVSTSLAYGQFFTYSQWERLPEEERQVYLAGAFDTVVGVEEAEDPWGLKNSLQRYVGGKSREVGMASQLPINDR